MKNQNTITTTPWNEYIELMEYEWHVKQHNGYEVFKSKAGIMRTINLMIKEMEITGETIQVWISNNPTTNTWEGVYKYHKKTEEKNMRITLDKENWTGEKVTINVNQVKRSFSLNGCKVTLEQKDKTIVEDWEWRTYNIMVDGWEYPLGVVVDHIDFAKDTQEIEAWHHEIKEGNLSRTGSSIYDAAAKMLCNVI